MGLVVEVHLPDQLVEIDWDLRFKSDSLPVVRMVEGNRSGMQRQARMIAIPTALFLIANHRPACPPSVSASCAKHSKRRCKIRS